MKTTNKVKKLEDSLFEDLQKRLEELDSNKNLSENEEKFKDALKKLSLASASFDPTKFEEIKAKGKLNTTRTHVENRLVTLSPRT